MIGCLEGGNLGVALPELLPKFSKLVAELPEFSKLVVLHGRFASAN